VGDASVDLHFWREDKTYWKVTKQVGELEIVERELVEGDRLKKHNPIDK